MSVTLVLTDEIADQLAEASQIELETAGVLLATAVTAGNGDIRLLGQELLWVDEAAYLQRRSDGLSIASDGYVQALGRAEALGATPIWLHSHPGLESPPTPSKHDRLVDEQISDLFRLRSGSNFYGATIVSPRNTGFAFTGHLESNDGMNFPIDRLWIVGDRLRLETAFDTARPRLSANFDRNIKAFGEGIQQTLGGLRVGITGCGGTGSIVAEQLARLGVRDFILIDPDRLSESNVTRVYGSSPSDVGKMKVDVLADHIETIASGSRCERIGSTVIRESVARRLVECDLVFGCTDDNAGRLVLSRLATYFLIPVIDLGVLLTSRSDGSLVGIDGRVTILVPGQACLVCRDRIDLTRARAEVLTPEERVRREDEGYAPALGRVEPAVVAFTTMIGAAAVGELLERLIGYGPDPRPSEILVRYHERDISTNLARPREGHYCHSSAGKRGCGMKFPFLEQSWAA